VPRRLLADLPQEVRLEMSDYETAIKNLAERLSKIEAQNKQLKILALVAIALAILSVRGKVQASPVQNIVADAVTAHSFALTDHNGNRLAELVSTGDHVEYPVMRMYGVEPLAKGGTVLRLTIGVAPDPEMTVYRALGPSEHLCYRTHPEKHERSC
jgi:hypothetical protein